ncbi:MAG: hypothetical protein ABR973_07985 [Candidatus Acidiferrales bacterium]
MAIELIHRGKRYRADTPKEAAELRHLLEEQDRDAGVSSSPLGFLSALLPHVWSPDEALELVQGLGDLQQKFLAALVDRENPSSQILCDALKLDSEVALAGVISGLSKQVRKLGHNSRELYEVQVKWNGKHKERFFKIQPGFKTALNEIGWPDVWENEKAK